MTTVQSALWHVFRYGQLTHQCHEHTVYAISKSCAHCNDVGACPHLAYDRCDCGEQRPCSDCTFFQTWTAGPPSRS